MVIDIIHLLASVSINVMFVLVKNLLELPDVLLEVLNVDFEEENIVNGEEWFRQRKILSNPLMLKIGHYVEVLDELVLETISQIVIDYTVNGRGTFRVESITKDFAVNAFGTLLYGYKFDNTFKENGNIWKQFADMAKANFDDAKKLLITPEWMMKMHPAWKRHNTRWNFLLKTNMDTIERCMKDMKNDCILASLLHGRKLNDKEIFINLTDLLVASIDTTNTTLQWCLYELACNPDVQGSILTEAEKILGGRIQLKKADLNKLVYLKAVLWEALRLHPVGFFTSRIILEEMNVRGLKIPPKTHVAISMYVMGRNKVLFPHPDCFRPERWLTDCNKIKIFPHDVFFGFGPRMCLGRKIAEMEIMLFLLRFCMEFEFSTKDSQIDPIVKLMLSPSRPVELDTKRRNVDN